MPLKDVTAAECLRGEGTKYEDTRVWMELCDKSYARRLGPIHSQDKNALLCENVPKKKKDSMSQVLCKALTLAFKFFLIYYI